VQPSSRKIRIWLAPAAPGQFPYPIDNRGRTTPAKVPWCRTWGGGNSPQHFNWPRPLSSSLSSLEYPCPLLCMPSCHIYDTVTLAGGYHDPTPWFPVYRLCDVRLMSFLHDCMSRISTPNLHSRRYRWSRCRLVLT
jgi:hypothetical protein